MTMLMTAAMATMMMVVVVMVMMVMAMVVSFPSEAMDMGPQSRCRPSLTNFTSSLRTGFWRCCFL